MVNAPSGGSLQHFNVVQGLDIDDQFFHITCHIEESVHKRIEAGAYVDLEKLLPKPKGRPGVNENKMELVYRDGHSYFIPAQQEGKINRVHRWEQAFRVYATIYSQANPSRSAEIWQYVHTINTAAASYQWDNVVNYDFTFHQLMGTFPQRSWAKICNQMWYLSMKDPVQKNYFANSLQKKPGTIGSHNFQTSNPTSSSGTNQVKKSKVHYCWPFNKEKGGFCKDGPKCKFVNRCSYCDAADHGLPACPKANAQNNPK